MSEAKAIEVFIIGIGVVGMCLVEQIKEQHDVLLKQNVDIKVCGLCNSKAMKLDKNGIDLANWKEEVKGWKQKSNIEVIVEFIKENEFKNPVFVDCTASMDTTNRYSYILSSGIHIVTANKRANTQGMDYFCELRNIANRTGKMFLYETNVGAGLPVIESLQTLLKTGDKLISFYGIPSGSLSFLFGKLDEGMKFSDAVKIARDSGFTEPDPRDDLSYEDAIRKVMILARESGIPIERKDINVKPLFPPAFDITGNVNEFMSNLTKIDDYFKECVRILKSQNKVMRFATEIRDGKCYVGIIEVDPNNPLYSVRDGENIFVFQTKRYEKMPFIIRGYGAGDSVTASGLFGNILQTVSWNYNPFAN